MLDTITKRRIDTARDILVGKLPDPKSQVEQITIALIYKFMDDMDKQSEELGGKATFFTGEYEKYSWSKIFDPRVSGYELVGLYGEAIQKMNHNPHIPQLFRNIFKNAYLPYRDPETLKMFLKVIGEFEYDHSEKLGDAFEYLLSIMGSQGDAGQFRTPRHIIDFMVKVVDPCKNETVLDPACGTAGFLISSFNHILNKNKKDNRLNLTADERKRLIDNFSGYDISPDMVRLSLVNMYLHKFPAPKIYEYDTLTSEEKWNEFYDVILANPPFMSPKGGIKPHKRFSIQAKRSEVLFVDYIAEHLNPNGRGGVIVPEGIIFQSGIAYKKLRKMLIENLLYAVASLPAGVFNPYSGVKTSILFLDKNLSKKSDKILFVKINNDGFGLGAQRRETKENDLPMALEIIKKYKKSIIEGKEIEFDLDETKIAHIVEKKKIIESGDYNLSGDRYKEAVVYNGQWDFVELGEICEISSGSRPKGGAVKEGILSIGGEHIKADGRFKLEKSKFVPIDYYRNLKKGKLKYHDVLIVKDGATTGKTGYFDVNSPFAKGAVNEHVFILRVKDKSKIMSYYLYRMVKSNFGQKEILKFKVDGGIGGINLKIREAKIPLLPLEIQEQIVAELESYQKIIDGAKQVVENYKPTFKIDPEWEIKKVEELCNLVRGSSPRPKGDKRYYGGKIPRLMISDITRDGMYTSPKKDTLTEIGARLSRPMKKGNVIMAVSGNPGLPTILAIDACIHDGFVGFKDLSSSILPEFLYLLLLHCKDTNNMQSIGAVFKNLNTNQIKHFNIPVPSIQVQKQIITKIENEQKIINANKELITIFENKIKDKIAEVWGE